MTRENKRKSRATIKEWRGNVKDGMRMYEQSRVEVRVKSV